MPEGYQIGPLPANTFIMFAALLVLTTEDEGKVKRPHRKEKEGKVSDYKKRGPPGKR
jgi:hypothetical protein